MGEKCQAPSDTDLRYPEIKYSQGRCLQDTDTNLTTIRSIFISCQLSLTASSSALDSLILLPSFLGSCKTLYNPSFLSRSALNWVQECENTVHVELAQGSLHLVSQPSHLSHQLLFCLPGRTQEPSLTSILKEGDNSIATTDQLQQYRHHLPPLGQVGPVPRGQPCLLNQDPVHDNQVLSPLV